MHCSFIVLVMSLFATFVVADLHVNGICVNDNKIFNENATISACAAYLARNTGTNPEDTCPDCTYVTTDGPPYCNSAAKHLGGVEITEYCIAAGATDALTS